MFRHRQTTRYRPHQRAGVALIVAVVALIVLSSLLAGLSVRVTMVKRRQAYIVEYQRARYAMDSALKYALSTMPRQNFRLSDRQDMPDFSDLFVMNGDQYRLFLQYWTETATDDQIEKVLKPEALQASSQLDSAEMLSRLADLFGFSATDANTPATSPAPSADALQADEWGTVLEFDPNDFQVPGPYGPSWPYVIEPIELQIGSARATITIEDENAKLPLAWTITNREAVNKEAEAVLSVFCDWMGIDPADQQALQDQLAEIYEHKVFELNPSPILLQPQRTTAAAPQAGRVTTTRTTARQRQVPQPQAQATGQQRPAVAHAADFGKLFHSALLDRETLARPLKHTALPDQSPLNYLSLWGSQRVNINTAPRHVLEAALTFGGDSPKDLAEKIIQLRQEAPIQSIEELKQTLYGDSMAIERAKDYLTTTSNFFLIRVVGQSGNARVTAVATVIKEGRTVEQLAVLYGL